MTQSRKKRPYIPPTITKVDLEEAGNQQRKRGGTFGFLYGQAVSQFTTNVTGGSLSASGPPPRRLRK